MRVSDLDTELECATGDGRGPVVLRRPDPGMLAHTWLADERRRIEEIVGSHGGVLLRDLGIKSVSEFNRAVQVFSPDLLDCVHLSTPRSRVGGKLYTATEYPADRVIPLHNENSYSAQWPNRIYFFWLVAAPTGGETPTADSRRVYQRIDPAVRERFERTGVRYVRSFTDGIDLSWPEVFQTDDRAEYCTEHGIEFEWPTSGPVLRTRQRCQATLRHPVTNESVWFNQAHLFHISAIAEGEQASLVDEHGAENLPRNAYYGDDAPIETDVLEHIRDAYEREKTSFTWQRGDSLMLDNLLLAHGRNTFSGSRRIVVAMA